MTPTQGATAAERVQMTLSMISNPFPKHSEDWHNFCSYLDNAAEADAADSYDGISAHTLSRLARDYVENMRGQS